MAYRIEYGQDGAKKGSIKHTSRNGVIVSVSLVLLLVAGAVGVKLTGLPWIEKYLIPGDPAVTAAALEDLAQNIQEGESIADAVSAFCRQIMENG